MHLLLASNTSGLVPRDLLISLTKSILVVIYGVVSFKAEIEHEVLLENQNIYKVLK